MSHSIGADSEVGRLRTVLVHRPGAELRRLTPRTRQLLESGCLPWVDRAQQEHDVLTDVLRERGVDVLYVTELLADVLAYRSAREEAIAAALACSDLGAELGPRVADYLGALPPADLADALIAGLTAAELPGGRGLPFELLGPHDFVLDPVPGLVYSRDSSVVIGDQVVIANLTGPRRREAGLLAAVFGHHPRFAGLAAGPGAPAAPAAPAAGAGPLDGGNVLLLAPGVVAVGVGARTTPAAAEALARRLFDAGVAHTMLVVPLAAGRLDLVCTFVSADIVIMVPALAFTLNALTVTAGTRDPGLAITRPWPFLEAAARAMGVNRLTVIDTGTDPPSGQPGQWDNGGNALAIGQRTVICEERNTATNSRLAAAGFEVIAIPATELAAGGGRGGPRSLCAALERDSRDMDNAAQLLTAGVTGSATRELASAS